MSSFSLRTDHVRVVAFLKRKEGISKEEFTRRWLLHAALFKSTEMYKDILKYEQMHVNDETNALLKGGGALTCEWDGIALIEGESFEKVLSILSSEEFFKVLAPDEEDFLDRAKTTVVPLNFCTFKECING